VDGQAFAIVRQWAEDPECDVREPRCTPWLGGAAEKVKKAVETLKLNGGGQLDVGPMEEARKVLKTVEDALSGCERRKVDEDLDLNTLVEFWADVASNKEMGSFTAKLAR
jgi:hypothetical protein